MTVYDFWRDDLVRQHDKLELDSQEKKKTLSSKKVKKCLDPVIRVIRSQAAGPCENDTAWDFGDEKNLKSFL